MKTLLWLCVLLLFVGPAACLADEVPLTREGGVFHVPATINGSLTLEFVVDSGAADVVLPQSAVDKLVQSGALATADRLQDGVAVTADGSHIRTPRYTLRSLTVGGVTVEQVRMSVVPSGGEPLLGQAFLSRLPYWQLDTTRDVLVVGSPNSHVADTAHLFSAATVNDLNSRIEKLQHDHHTDVFIITVMTFGNDTRDQVANRFTHGRTIDGILILISLSDKKTDVKVATRTARLFPNDVILQLKQAMNDQFRHQLFDPGITAGLTFIEKRLTTPQ